MKKPKSYQVIETKKGDSQYYELILPSNYIKSEGNQTNQAIAIPVAIAIVIAIQIQITITITIPIPIAT